MNKLKALCLHSLTNFWAYVLALFGGAIALLPAVAEVVADPEVSTAIRDTLPAAWVGYYTIALAGITLACRLRGIIVALRAAKAGA